MIKQLIEKHKQEHIEKSNNKPKYKLKDLYIGEIVLYKYRKDVRLGVIDYHYDMVKKFAILKQVGYQKYLHIKSNQELYVMGSYYCAVNDYAVHRVRKFTDVSRIYMRINNLSLSTKVSLNFIKDYENEMNNLLAPDEVVNEMFK